MLELFEEIPYPYQIKVYYNRLPKKDGENPNSNRLCIAYALFFINAIFLYSVMKLDVGTSHFHYRLIIFGTAGLWLATWITRQYFQLVYCSRMHRIYRSYIFFKLNIARFEDILSIRLRLEESDGRITGFYVAVWRNDPYRKPLRLSPRGKTVTQLAHYRHTIMPRVRKLMWGDAPDTLTDPSTNTVSTSHGAVPNRAAPILKKILTSQNKKMAPAQPKAEVKASCWIEVWLTLVLGAFGIVVAVAMFFLATPEVKDMYSFGLTLFLMGFMRIAASLIGCWLLYRLFLHAARRSVGVRIDPRKKQIHIRSLFGFHTQTVTFDALLEITVKHRWQKSYICLVIDGYPADPVVATAFSSPATKAAITKICGAMDLEPRQWFDLLAPEVQYSSAYKRRILGMANPYFEQ